MPAQFGDSRLPQRFWDKVEPEPNTGCWLWTGAASNYGYGHYRYGNRTTVAHRLTWSELRAPLTKGLVLDHLCSIVACVNPEHLREVTQGENARAGKARVMAGNAPSTNERGRLYGTAKERSRRRIQRKLNAGLCIICGTEQAVTKYHCRVCADRVCEITRKNREQHVANGVCEKGDGRPLASKSLCAVHLEKTRLRKLARKANVHQPIAA